MVIRLRLIHVPHERVRRIILHHELGDEFKNRRLAKLVCRPNADAPRRPLERIPQNLPVKMAGKKLLRVRILRVVLVNLPAKHGFRNGGNGRFNHRPTMPLSKFSWLAHFQVQVFRARKVHSASGNQTLIQYHRAAAFQETPPLWIRRQ